MTSLESEKNPLLTKAWQFICCFYEGTYCWWLVTCCPPLQLRDPPKPDIQYILQHNDSNEDSVSDSSTSLLRQYSGSSSLSSSISSVKDLKADIYQQIELRRSNSTGSKKLPVIDVRPIEFWPGVKGEEVQPRQEGGPLNSPGFPLTPNSFPRSPKWSDRKDNDALSKIRPHLYPSTSSSSIEEVIEEEDLGRLHYAYRYDATEAALIVRVIEASDLPLPASKDKVDNASSNPYVRVSLLPDLESAMETDVKKKTQDPVFEETFVFPVTYPDVLSRNLEFKIKDFDKFSRHCVIGKVVMPMSSANLAKPAHVWKSIVSCESTTENELGRILLSINFLPMAGRLNVDVIRAKQLLKTNIGRGADPYVRVSLVLKGRHHKSKKTSVRKNSLEPSFHESFNFNVSPSDLVECSVVVTVWDFNAGVIKDEFIGRVVLGITGSGELESSHWANMMTSERHAIAQWHLLKSRAQCDLTCSSSITVP